MKNGKPTKLDWFSTDLVGALGWSPLGLICRIPDEVAWVRSTLSVLASFILIPFIFIVSLLTCLFVVPFEGGDPSGMANKIALFNYGLIILMGTVAQWAAVLMLGYSVFNAIG